jgi:hypothetical protein
MLDDAVAREKADRIRPVNRRSGVIWQAKQTIVGMLGAVIRHEVIPPADPLPLMVARIEAYYSVYEEDE